jgi:hypothetical protein
VEAKGFKTMQLAVDVQMNSTANGSIKLQIGQESTVVEVQASEVQVNWCDRDCKTDDGTAIGSSRKVPR